MGESALSEYVPSVQLSTVAPQEPLMGIFCEQDAVLPPFDPTQSHRYCVAESALSEYVPAVQLLSDVEHEPLMGAVTLAEAGAVHTSFAPHASTHQL